MAENLIYPDKARKKKEKQLEVKSKNIRRIASIERSRESVMEEILTDAVRRNPNDERPLVAIMDGALYLWDALIIALMGINWVGILDIIHVIEYLWKSGNALHGENTLKTQKWVYDHLLLILQGQVDRVIDGLKQVITKQKLSDSKKQAIQKTITYFENHKQWMKYDEYLKQGYPIGSGVVESTCGHTVSSRMEGAGRRWSIKGAEAMLLLRSVYTSNDWDDYWQNHIEIEHQKLYGDILPSLGLPNDYYGLKAA